MLTIHDYETPSDKAWHLVVQGVRNSWESHEKSDSLFIEAQWDSPSDIFTFGAADMALALRLVRTGADHGKFMRQLAVVVDVSAANYFWREFDTYRIGIEASDITQNSTSQMHVLGKHQFAADMFSWEDTPSFYQEAQLSLLNNLRQRWINAGKHKGPQAEEWRGMLQAIPDSWNYRRCVSLNYQVLRSMYHARRAHRLSEWRIWCEWVALLPYGELITVE